MQKHPSAEGELVDFQLTNDDDEIIGTDQIDRVTIRGVGGTDWLDLRGGNDLVDGESERVTLLAGAGNDLVRYQVRSSLASAFRGGEGNDHFIITDIGGRSHG